MSASTTEARISIPRATPLRVEAVKLRARLAEYYVGIGTGDQLRISIPKGGYIATFLEVATVMPAGRRGSSSRQPEIRSRSFHYRWLTAGLLATAALVTAGFVFRHSPEPTAGPSLMPFTTYPGHEFRPSLSPDGRYAVFGWSGGLDETNFDIYLRPVGERWLGRYGLTPTRHGRARRNGRRMVSGSFLRALHRRE